MLKWRLLKKQGNELKDFIDNFITLNLKTLSLRITGMITSDAQNTALCRLQHAHY